MDLGSILPTNPSEKARLFKKYKANKFQIPNGLVFCNIERKKLVGEIDTCQTVSGIEDCQAGLVDGLFEVDFRTSELNGHSTIGINIPDLIAVIKDVILFRNYTYRNYTLVQR